MHYSDDEQPARARSGGGDDDLVGPRRGRAQSPDDLVGPRRGARRSILDDDDGDGPRIPAPRLRRGGGREIGGMNASTIRAIVRDIPSFIKLFARLARDPRVSRTDKAIVAAVLVYFVSPIDLIPDFIVPVLGQLEDVYLLALALSRLINNAGIEVVLDHWDGDTASLETALAALDRAGAMLPGPIRSLLGARAG